jgi:hypothetical protein
MCQGWLYLHCGVPVGHVFDGRLELLLAVDRDGLWKAVSPHWRSRRQYSLHGTCLWKDEKRKGMCDMQWIEAPNGPPKLIRPKRGERRV